MNDPLPNLLDAEDTEALAYHGGESVDQPWPSRVELAWRFLADYPLLALGAVYAGVSGILWLLFYVAAGGLR